VLFMGRSAGRGGVGFRGCMVSPCARLNVIRRRSSLWFTDSFEILLLGL
jgi:hypothetical protein